MIKKAPHSTVYLRRDEKSMFKSALGLKNVTVMEQFISDHKAVCFNLNLRKPLNERRTVVSRKLKGFDFDAFNEMIGSSGLSNGCISKC